MHTASQTYRFIHHARQTFHIYTFGKTNFSDLYTLQDKLFIFLFHARQPFRFLHPVSQTFQISIPCKTNSSDLYTLHVKLFRIVFPARQTFQISTHCRTKVSDIIPLHDKLFRCIHPTSLLFRFILSIRQFFRFPYLHYQPFQINTPSARQVFQIYTPCKPNVSDCYKLQDKLFRFIHTASHTFRFMQPARQPFRIIQPARQTIQIYTHCRTTFSDLYSEQDKFFRFMHPANNLSEL